MASFKILDGAIGSELIRRGLTLPEYIWSADANMNYPELVLQIHEEYIDAGADYITTNTFRTTPRAYLKTGINSKKASQMAKNSLVRAVELAKNSALPTTKIIGSMAPLEDCYRPDLFPGRDVAISEFSLLGKWMAEAGVDILLLETMNSIAEMEAGLIALQNYNHQIWVSFVLKNDKSLLSGDSLIDALNMVKNYRVDTILLNCNPLTRTLDATQNLLDCWPNKWGVYPNLGVGGPSPDGHILHYEEMDCFLSTMEKIMELGPFVLGACCGSSPKHIIGLNNLQYEFSK